MILPGDLTDEQRGVVHAGDGPLLVLAGPGSGKTRVLVARVCHLIGVQRVPPNRILVLTFASRAADEVRARLIAEGRASGREVDVATYHAFGWRVVHRWRAELGYGLDPLRVCSDGEQQTLLELAARGTGLPSVPPTLSVPVLHRYRCGFTPPASPLLPALASVYEALLCRSGAIDYPAMLLLPLRLLQSSPAALRELQMTYDYILADEFQDTSMVQYALLRNLAWKHRNLILVGDPDQSLYGWRDADGSAFRAFVNDFPDARLGSLTQNFRSSGRIVALANAVRPGRFSHRELWTANPPGPLPVLREAEDEQGEAAFVAREIGRLAAQGTIHGPGDVAVLYRTHAQVPPLADALQRHGLPSMQVRDTDDPDGSDASQVRLMTVHAAKGGEWPVVFLVGAEEGLLPHVHATDLTIEDERNVAYVAVTRPKRQLYLSYCRRRGVTAMGPRGSADGATPPAARSGHGPRRLSRFFTDLPEGTLARVA